MTDIRIPDIRCARCNKIVDRTMTYIPPDRRVVVFEAQCHGAVDRCEIPFKVFQNRGQFVDAVAFQGALT